MTRLLLVDDHPVVGIGTKTTLEQEGMDVTYVTSGTEALEQLAEQNYDLYLVDLHLPDINGVELTKKILEIDQDTPILIYTGYDVLPYFNLLVKIGVSGILSKTATTQQLINSIHFALQGEVILPIPVFRELRRIDVSITAPQGYKDETKNVNHEEHTILVEVAKGKRNREIAEGLKMSQRNVEYKMANLFRKFNVDSRKELVNEARRLRLIPNEELLNNIDNC